MFEDKELEEIIEKDKTEFKKLIIKEKSDSKELQKEILKTIS
jgi:hypothetical protein